MVVKRVEVHSNRFAAGYWGGSAPRTKYHRSTFVLVETKKTSLF